MLDCLADIMTFGKLLPCKDCGGQFVYKSGGYTCTGNLTEWTKCTKITKEPERAKFTVPKSYKETYGFLKSYKYVPRTRFIKDIQPTVVLKKEQNDPDNDAYAFFFTTRCIPIFSFFHFLGQKLFVKDLLYLTCYS